VLVPRDAWNVEMEWSIDIFSDVTGVQLGFLSVGHGVMSVVDVDIQARTESLGAGAGLGI
jgi:hypothetical protein